MRRILTLLVENEPGTLSRVTNLFSARGYNIDSLTVAPTQDNTLSRMTIITQGDDATVEQITKQINKLIEVFRVFDITEESHLEHELLLVKINAEGQPQREELKRVADIFGGKIIHVCSTHFIVQVVGSREKVDRFLQAVEPQHLIEVARTGSCAINRDKAQ